MVASLYQMVSLLKQCTELFMNGSLLLSTLGRRMIGRKYVLCRYGKPPALLALFVLLTSCSTTHETKNTEDTSILSIAKESIDLPIEHWQTLGAEVYFIRRPEIPMLDIKLVFDAGSARDENLKGVAALTSQMIGEETANHSPQALSERYDELGVKFSTESYRDMSIVSLRTLTQAQILTDALSLFSETIGQPKFSPAVVDRKRRQLLALLNQKTQSPDTVAELAFYQSVYGKHPYANPPLGKVEDVKLISPKHVIDFYQQYFTRGNLVIALVGDLTTARAKQIGQQLVKSLQPGLHASPLPIVPQHTDDYTQVSFVSEQTHIQIGSVGIRRGEQRYPALYVGNHILGGSGLHSRLMDAVRVKQGLTYGVWSYFVPMRAPGPFIMSLQTRNQEASKAIAAVKDTVQSFLAEGPTEQELQMAKEQIVSDIIRNLSTNRGLVNQIAMIGFYQLPLDHINRFIDAIADVDQESILQAFQEYVQLERMHTVVVGSNHLQSFNQSGTHHIAQHTQKKAND